MKVRMSFHYDGPLDEKLDERLRLLGEEIGFKWYGQGTHLETGKRDLAFSREFAWMIKTHKEYHEEQMKKRGYRFWWYLYWPYYKIVLPLWIRIRKSL